jgi:two-component system response regulator ChvI
MTMTALSNVSSTDTGAARMAAAIARVALVDDDEAFRQTLGLTLADEGYDVRAFDRTEAALDFLANGGETDVLLLDWDMPDAKGAEVLRSARSRGIGAPVICLADEVKDAAEEIALANGAVDFIEKSRRLPILLRRIALAIDGVKGSQEPQVTVQSFGHLELRLDQSRAFWKGRRLELTLTEFNMVKLLVSRPEEDVSYREIYDLVHGQGFLAGHGGDGFRANVRAFIKRIRQKFRVVDPGFNCIGNYPGFGYRWTSAGKAETAAAEQEAA